MKKIVLISLSLVLAICIALPVAYSVSPNFRLWTDANLGIGHEQIVDYRDTNSELQTKLFQKQAIIDSLQLQKAELQQEILQLTVNYENQLLSKTAELVELQVLVRHLQDAIENNEYDIELLEADLAGANAMVSFLQSQIQTLTHSSSQQMQQLQQQVSELQSQINDNHIYIESLLAEIEVLNARIIELSQSQNVQQLSAPENIGWAVYRGSFKHSVVENAKAYLGQLYLLQDDEWVLVYSLASENLIYASTSWTPEFGQMYKVVITAFGENHLSSSSSVTFIAQPEQLGVVSNFNLIGNYLYWDLPEGIVLFDISIELNGEIIALLDNVFMPNSLSESYFISAGDYVVHITSTASQSELHRVIENTASFAFTIQE